MLAFTHFFSRIFHMTSRYGEAIAERREAQGFARQTDLIHALGRLLAEFPSAEKFSQQWLSRLERDRSGEIIASAHGPKLRSLAQVLGWSMQELEQATGVDLGYSSFDAFERNMIKTAHLQDAGLHQEPDGVKGTVRIRVPVLALAAAGVGVWSEDQVVTYIELEPEIASRPNRVTFCVDGASMEPTLEHGDFIHVDIGDTDIREGKIYVVVIHGNGVVVKRARFYGGEHVWLISDNTASDYPPLRPDDAKVIGRVYAHTPQTRRL